MYRATRISADYQVVLLEKGAGQDVRHYCYHRRARDIGQAETVFREITEAEAAGYFSRQADGMGFGDGPEDPFSTLQDALTWVRSKQTQRVYEGASDLLDALMAVKPITKAEFQERLRRYDILDRWPEFEKRYEGKFKP